MTYMTLCPECKTIQKGGSICTICGTLVPIPKQNLSVVDKPPTDRKPWKDW